MDPVRAEAPIAGPLAPTFFYNGNNTSFSNSGISVGWFFNYGETLTPVSGGLLWIDRFGFRRTYAGDDINGYSFLNPGDARGTIALVAGNYVLTTPDGVSRTFKKGGSGYWLKTVDRWGNGAQNATATAPITQVQELFGGATTGRQITLAYNGKSQLTSVTDVNSGVTQLGYDGNGRLWTICSADQNCALTPRWRTFTYDGASQRLTTVTDAASQVIRAFSYDSSGNVQYAWIGATTFSAGKEQTKYTIVAPVPPATQSWTITVSRYKDDGTTADTTYVVQGVTGLWRVMSIAGACPECGDENSTYGYDGSGYVNSRTDGNGHVTTKTFDAYGNATPIVEASGTGLARSTQYTYADPVTDLPLSWGNVRDFWKTKTQPSGVNTLANKFVTTTRSWGGMNKLTLTETVTGYTSSGPGAPLTSRITTTTYDATGRVLSIDGPRGDVTDVTTFSYYTNTETTVANRNRLKQQVDAVGVTTTFDLYHPLGGVDTQTAHKGTLATDADVVTKFGYDVRGRLTTRTLKATPATSEQDLITTNAYDPRGRLTSTAVNAGTSPATTKTLYVYEDGTDRLLTRTESTQPSPFPGDRITYAYDNQGNAITETYGVFNGTTISTDYQVTRNFDGRCHVKSQTFPADAATTNYTYDCLGNLSTAQDSLHSTPNFSYLYDALNRLQTVTRTADSTIYGYDAMDHLTSVRDPNSNNTIYFYDDFGALREQDTTLAGPGQLDSTTNTYDEANNLKSTFNGQRGSRRTYDAANRLLTHKSVSGPITYTLYSYDTDCLQDPATGLTFGMGRLCQMTDDSGTTKYGYDRRGLVTAETKALIGANHTYIPFLYSYDAAGRRTGVTYPTGDTVTTSYSDSSRPVSMSFTPPGGQSSALISSIAHKAFGPITGWNTQTSTVIEARTFDTRFRRLSQTTKFGTTTLLGLNYGNGTDPTTGYDKEGNLLALNDTVDANSNRTFGYHPDRYFLTSSTGPYGSGYASLNLSWTYDPTGNRLTETRGVSPTAYTYGNDGSGHSNGVLASVAGVSVTSLSTGDLLADVNGATHLYDAFGRLSRVFAPTCRATFNAFSHDGNGHRVIRTSQLCGPTALKREDFLYGSDGKLLFYQPFNNLDVATGREEYVWLEDELVAIVRSAYLADNGTFFLHGDQLSRPLAMTSTAGTMVWRGEYEPFGKSLVPRMNSLSFAPRFRFPGQWENGDSGDLPGGATGLLGSINALTDNWYRTYAQRWGRYTQPDPIGLQSDLNLYRYAIDNPLSIVDPNGLQAASEVIRWGMAAGSMCTMLLEAVPPVLVGTAVVVGVAVVARECAQARRCGNCTPGEYDGLRANVQATCKGGILQKCTPGQDMGTLTRNAAVFLACAAARDEINNRCFGGGDAGHSEQADNMRRGAITCLRLLIDQRKGR